MTAKAVPLPSVGMAFAVLQAVLTTACRRCLRRHEFGAEFFSFEFDAVQRLDGGFGGVGGDIDE